MVVRAVAGNPNAELTDHGYGERFGFSAARYHQLMNRVIDRRMDARNPRTQSRELPDFTWERTDRVDDLRAAAGL